jgi:hypothetical protein
MSAPAPAWNNPPQNSHINPIVVDDSPPRPPFDPPKPQAFHPPSHAFPAPLFSPSAFAPPPYPPPAYPHPQHKDDIDAQQYFDQQCAAAAFSPNTTRMHPDFEEESASMALFDVAPPPYPPPPQLPPSHARIDVNVDATPTKSATGGAALTSPGVAGYSPFIHGYSAGQSPVFKCNACLAI